MQRGMDSRRVVPFSLQHLQQLFRCNRASLVSIFHGFAERWTSIAHSPASMRLEEDDMKKYLLAAAMTCAIATPVLADDVGVRVGPVGAGVTVGESHEYRDRDRDRTVIREREPRDKTTVIKKDENGVRSKTVIHDRD
jgi:hypothetical protein